MSTALLVGRFQPLHLGHEELFKYCKLNFDSTIVLIGKDPDGRTPRNPLTGAEREKIIESSFPSVTTGFVTETWEGDAFKQQVEKTLTDLPTEKPITLVTENETTMQSLNSLDCNVDRPTPNALNGIICRGSEIRTRIIQDRPWEFFVSSGVREELQRVCFVEKVREVNRT